MQRIILLVSILVLFCTSLTSAQITGPKVGEIVDLGVAAGIIEKSGAGYSYNSNRIGQGRENVKKFLLDNK